MTTMTFKATENTKAFTMNSGFAAYVSKQRNLVAKEAPKTKFCPCCKKERAVKFFGVRTHRDTETGKPVRFSLQSYCVDCRNKPKPAAKPAPKVTAKPKAKAKAAKPAPAPAAAPA